MLGVFSLYRQPGKFFFLTRRNSQFHERQAFSQKQVFNQHIYAFVLVLPKTTSSICSWFLLLGFPDEMGLGERALEDAYSIEVTQG